MCSAKSVLGLGITTALTVRLFQELQQITTDITPLVSRAED